MQKKICRNFPWLLLALVFICFSGPLTKLATGGFMIHKIQSHSALDTRDPTWITEPLESEEKIHRILNQKFYYFGHGRQSFVFVSEDDQYVIKFLNKCHHSTNHLRWYRGITCIFLAYRELKEDSGLLMIHLSSDKCLNKSVTIIDGCHIAHTIDLDKTQFLLQKKMKMPFDAIQSAMQQGNENLAKDYIEELFAFIRKRLDNGILDYDSTLYTNYGFIEGKAFQLDCGTLTKAKCPEDYRKDLKHFKFRNESFLNWLNKNYPSLAPYYYSQLESLEDHYQRICQKDKSL